MELPRGACEKVTEVSWDLRGSNSAPLGSPIAELELLVIPQYVEGLADASAGGRSNLVNAGSMVLDGCGNASANG